MARSGPEETRARLLDAAERILAEEGFAAASLRRITRAAGTNLAAVHYHFGAKAGLVEAVFRRRLEPLNRARLEALERLERAGTAPGVRDLLLALIAPALRMGRDPATGGARFMRLLGRAYVEPDPQVRALLHGLYGEVRERYFAAFTRALPGLPREELAWRLHFVLGTIAYAMAGSDALELVTTCDWVDPDDVEALGARLIPFLEAGLRAPLDRGEEARGT
ncbi:TetR/AcrR family transcriptional regulator [Inmirania thermothiophila]|uniref:TetR family transcriptional regulator n=1 Tax=Inmirania thermothiophila TaxID=1750597 RepID=A0A3N1XT80_9GAMM|nr:TetR/AcrR family transcriptional regulator [Inmirania thermothiophila]ROR29840.1 TetR family transcriptional regulator [Inmirania thermothiophila]